MKLAQTTTDVRTGAAAVTDTQLVRRCLDGDEAAWEALVHRYRRLIYSVPLKYGATAEEAGEVFQAVCVDLVTELPRLRKPEALKGWLVSVARHKALRWKTRARREHTWAASDDLADVLPSDDPDAARLIEDVQREQGVRAAIEALPERCQELVRLLFYGNPPPPYAEVARRLGLATGSIGFIRGRCLKKLEAALKAQGF
ncbi:MAG: RNA polymerase sigma factor [Planctomycetota bacterium]